MTAAFQPLTVLRAADLNSAFADTTAAAAQASAAAASAETDAQAAKTSAAQAEADAQTAITAAAAAHTLAAAAVPSATVGQHGGPAGPLDANGLIPAAQIPGGGGGGGSGPSAAVYFGGFATAATETPPGEYEFGIRASHNVSSVVRNNPGDYTINFATPMSSTDYVAVFGAGYGGDHNNSGDQISDSTRAVAYEPRGGLYVTRSVNFIRINTVWINGSNQGSDVARISVAIFDVPAV